MVINAGLLCGNLGQRKQVIGEFHRFIEENILAYAKALNHWLKGASWKLINRVEDARYVPKEVGLRIARTIHLSIGKKDKMKMWLAASLLKTIKDNQRWHRRAELIDDFPEAVSWFREILQTVRDT